MGVYEDLLRKKKIIEDEQGNIKVNTVVSEDVRNKLTNNKMQTYSSKDRENLNNFLQYGRNFVRSTAKNTIWQQMQNIMQHKPVDMKNIQFATKEQVKRSDRNEILQVGKDIGRVAENLWLGGTSGIKNSGQTVGRAITNTQADRIDFWNKQNQEMLKNRIQSNPQEKEEINKILENPFITGEQIREKSEKVTQKIQKEKEENIGKIQENADSIENPVGKYLASNIMPSIGQMAPGLVGGPLGTTYFISSATGNYYDDAKQRGMTDKEATIYSGTMGIIEGSLESLGAKLTTNVGKNLLRKNIKGALINYGLDIGENFLEEAIVEPVSEIVAQTTAGKNNANWENIGQRFLQSGIDGAITSMITGGISGVAGSIASNSRNNKYTDINTGELLNKDSQNWLKEAENIIDLNNTLNSQPQSTQIQQILPTQQINQQEIKTVQNGNMEQTVKRNIIDEKVKEYINQNRKSFKTDINIQTKVINEGEPIATNYKNAKETVIYKKAKDLFNKIGLKQFKNNNDTIYVTNQDIKESIRKTITNPEQKKQVNQNIAVFSSLDKVINNAKELDIAKEHKDRSKYDSWKYYISEVNIDNKPYVVEFDTVLREDGQRHFRLERVYNINNIGDSKTTLLAPIANEVVRYGISFY